MIININRKKVVENNDSTQLSGVHSIKIHQKDGDQKQMRHKARVQNVANGKENRMCQKAILTKKLRNRFSIDQNKTCKRDQKHILSKIEKLENKKEKIENKLAKVNEQLGEAEKKIAVVVEEPSKAEEQEEMEHIWKHKKRKYLKQKLAGNEDRNSNKITSRYHHSENKESKKKNKALSNLEEIDLIIVDTEAMVLSKRLNSKKNQRAIEKLAKRTQNILSTQNGVHVVTQHQEKKLRDNVLVVAYEPEFKNAKDGIVDVIGNLDHRHRILVITKRYDLRTALKPFQVRLMTPKQWMRGIYTLMDDGSQKQKFDRDTFVNGLLG